MTWASVWSIGLSCSILFAFLYSWQAFQGWAHEESRRQSYAEAFLAEESTAPEWREAEDLARRIALAEEVRLVTPELAREEFVRDFGPEMLEALDRNPLPASLRVRPTPAARGDTLVLRDLGTALQSLPHVVSVELPERETAAVQRLVDAARIGALALASLLAIVLFAVVRNSIELSIRARARLIDDMRLCGAKQWHIELPFAAEGFLQGLLGGLLAGIIPWSGLVAASRILPLPLPLRVDWGVRAWIVVLVFSGLLGSLSGWFTIRRSVR